MSRPRQEGINTGSFSDYDIILLNLNLPSMSAVVLRWLPVTRSSPRSLVSSGGSASRQGRTARPRRQPFPDQPVHSDELVAGVAPSFRARRTCADRHHHRGTLWVDVDEKTGEVDSTRNLLIGWVIVLELLAAPKGTTLRRGDLPDRCSGGMDEPSYEIINVFICRSRLSGLAARAATTSKPSRLCAQRPAQQQPAFRLEGEAQQRRPLHGMTEGRRRIFFGGSEVPYTSPVGSRTPHQTYSSRESAEEEDFLG